MNGSSLTMIGNNEIAALEGDLHSNLMNAYVYLAKQHAQLQVVSGHAKSEEAAMQAIMSWLDKHNRPEDSCVYPCCEGETVLKIGDVHVLCNYLDNWSGPPSLEEIDDITKAVASGISRGELTSLYDNNVHKGQWRINESPSS